MHFMQKNKNARMMLYCNSCESFCMVLPETTDFTKALFCKTKFLFLRCRSDSLLSFRLSFFAYSPSLSLSAWAAESAHQINTERGVVFRLEIAKQVTDNGNTWQCVNFGGRKESNSNANKCRDLFEIKSDFGI